MDESSPIITARQVKKDEGDLLGDILYPIAIKNLKWLFMNDEAVPDNLSYLDKSLRNTAAELSQPTSDQAGFFAFASDKPEQPVGFLRAMHLPNEGPVFIYQLWSHDDFVVDEVASTLFETATTWAKSKGSKQIKVVIPVKSEDELEFYEEHGFAEVNEEPIDHQWKLAKNPIRLLTLGKKI